MRRNASRGRIGAPPVRALLAAAVDLLLVHPVQLAVQNAGRSVGRQRRLALRRRIDDEQVVVADEGDLRVVRAERRLVFVARPRMSAGRCAAGGKVAEIQIVADRDERAV